MLLTKSRTLIVATGIIALVSLMLTLLVAGVVSAGNAVGPIPGQFGDNTAGADPSNQMGWDWTSAASNARVSLYLASNPFTSTPIYGIEVFVEPTTSTAPVLKDLRSTPLPTGQVLYFNFTTSTQLTGGSNVGIHLLNSAGADVVISQAPRNMGLLTPVATATPVPPPPPTPVPTTIVPTDQVTKVATPTNGAAVVIQPNAAATLSAPDGTVSVAVPILANATTFQLTYNPSPASVPAASADQKIVRAFEINAYNTLGTKVTLSLLSTAAVTVKYTAADVSVAPDKSPLNLKIARYDTTTSVWVALNTTVDLAAQTLTANTTTFSTYAMVTQVPPPQTVATPTPTATPVAIPTATPMPTATPVVTPTATPRPPSTGDVTPGSGMVLLMVLVGFILITAGGTYLSQTRRAKAQRS